MGKGSGKGSGKGRGKGGDDEEAGGGGCCGALYEVFKVVMSYVLGVEVEELGDAPMPKNLVLDMRDLPHTTKWSSFIFYEACFLMLFSLFFALQWIENTTSTFISLDPESGTCIDDPDQGECCEVPQVVTGNFLADTRGYWIVDPNFKYTLNAYSIDLLGLQYTNAKWKEIMQTIIDQVKIIGAKGALRDFSWNLVVWSSFVAQFKDLETGSLTFSTSGRAGVIYNKPVTNVGWASDLRIDNDTTSATYNQIIGGYCGISTTTSYDPLSSKMTIDGDLSDVDPDYTLYPENVCVDPPCSLNPCPGTLAPQLAGYDIVYSKVTDFEWQIDMQSVTTALAVNMGIRSLESLVDIPGDADRIALFKRMVNAGSISAAISSNTSSYFDPLYAPADPIYCTNYTAFTNVSGSSCFIRKGNMLMYPVTVSSGWSNTGVDRPKQCSVVKALVRNSPAKYYCNQMSVNVGFIYYAQDNQNVSELSAVATKRPTKSPTAMPSYAAGVPTPAPSIKPTRRPSYAPTKQPSSAPTNQPSSAPTNQPSSAPTNQPSSSPTAGPTAPTVALAAESSRLTRAASVPVALTAESSRLTRAASVPTLKTSAFSGILDEIALEEEQQPRASARTKSHPVAKISKVPSMKSQEDEEADFMAQNFHLAVTDSPTSDDFYFNFYYDFYIPLDELTAYTYLSPELNEQAENQLIYYFLQEAFADDDPAEALSAPTATDDYSRAVSQDDFVPIIADLIDNGIIFQFGYSAAYAYDKNPNRGDTEVPDNAFEIMTDVLLNNGTMSFADLCGDEISEADFFNNKSYPSGCSLFTFRVDGGDNRDVSDYYFQPSSQLAFSNTLFNARALYSLQSVTPTNLTQLYYSCIMNPWPAFFDAAGLANSNSAMYLAVGFTLIFSVMLHSINYERKPLNDPNYPIILSIKKKRMLKEKQDEIRATQLDMIIKQFPEVLHNAGLYAMEDEFRNSTKKEEAEAAEIEKGGDLPAEDVEGGDGKPPAPKGGPAGEYQA